MPNWDGLQEELRRILLLRGEVVGVKLLRDEAEAPEEAERPNAPLTICQVYQLARYHSKVSYAQREDIFCARGASAIGLEAVPEDIIRGKRDEKGKARDKDAASRLQQNIPRIPVTEGYTAVLMFPINKAKVEPELVIMTGSAAQMLRLCQATVYYLEGERLFFQTSGTQTICADCIATVKTTGKPNMSSPCYGSRYFAGFEEDEMVFALPVGYLEGVVQALKETHKGGYEYPILHEVEVTPFGGASLTIRRRVPRQAKHGVEITHKKL